MFNLLQTTGDQVRAFRDSATDQPIAVLHLLKFNEKAEHEGGRHCELTGQEDCQQGQQHRAARLDGQLLIECGSGNTF